MSLLNEQEAKKLIDKVLAFSKADEATVSITGGRTGNIRYARNTVTTNGETDNLSISVTSIFGNRSGTATGNELDDVSLGKLARRSEEVARFAPENPESMPLPGPQQYGTSATWSDNTAHIDPAFRVEAVWASLQECVAKNITAAGFLRDASSFTALGNNRGLFAYNRSTSGEFTITARTEDERGSGYSMQSFTDAAKLDTKGATNVAINKALASRDAKELKPGKYTVILEPQAANDLLQLMINAMDARTADEGRSFFGKRGEGNRIGSKLFHEQVHILSDPFHPESPGAPFTQEGIPHRKVSWIENGVLRNLPYSRYWAQQKGVEPLPSPTGFIMLGTDQTLDDLIRGTGKGILVTRFWYIRPVDPQTLVYTGLTRDGTFYIENGKVQYAIKNFRFNESPAAMLTNLEALGKPLRVENNLVPPLKIRDFNFTSLSDAV